MILKIKNILTCAISISLFLMSSTAADATQTAEDLRNSDISKLVKQSKFDSRDYGIVTPVRDQGDTSLCWAYSTASASETSILRSGIDKSVDKSSLSLSPQQIGYARHNRGSDPLNNTTGEITSSSGNWSYAGGGTKYAAALLSTWCGPVKSDKAYNVNGWSNAAYKLESAISVDGKNLNKDAAAREKMKRAIVKYGAVTFSYNNVREAYYYNPSEESGSSPHACTIIGWDDTIPAENFYPSKTTTDGGWLVKNSYSSLPYFYLSYEVTCEQIYAFDYVMNDKYDNNYFYDASATDSGIGSLLKIKQAANVFKVKGDTENEWIKAVSVGIVGENADCTVEVYSDVQDGSFNPQNAKLETTKTVYLEYGGFNCIELDKPVEVKKGSTFAVVVKVNNAYITLSENEGESYVYRGGWTPSQAVRIKVFTKNDEKNQNSIEFMDEGQVKVRGNSGIKQLIITMSENEELKDFYVESINFDENKEKIVTLPSGWIRIENICYKAFLWDNFENISPECSEIEW